MFIESLNVLYLQQLSDFVVDVGQITSEGNMQAKSKGVFDYHKRLVGLTQQLRAKTSTAKEKPRKQSTHSKHVTIKISREGQDNPLPSKDQETEGIIEAEPLAMLVDAEKMEEGPVPTPKLPEIDPRNLPPPSSDKNGGKGLLGMTKEDNRSESRDRIAMATSQALADRLFNSYERKMNTEGDQGGFFGPTTPFGPTATGSKHTHNHGDQINHCHATAPKATGHLEVHHPIHTPFIVRLPTTPGFPSHPQSQAQTSTSNPQNAFEMYRQINKHQGKFQFKKLRLESVAEEAPRWDFQENNYDISDCEEDGGSNDKAHTFEYEEDLQHTSHLPPLGSKGPKPATMFGAKRVAIRCNGKAIPKWARDLEAVAETARRQKEDMDYHEVFGLLPVINNLDVDKIFGTKGMFTKRGTSNQWATKSGIQQIRQEKKKRLQGLLVQDLK
jgi:hypothetical protein